MISSPYPRAMVTTFRENWSQINSRRPDTVIPAGTMGKNSSVEERSRAASVRTCPSFRYRMALFPVSAM